MCFNLCTQRHQPAFTTKAFVVYVMPTARSPIIILKISTGMTRRMRSTLSCVHVYLSQMFVQIQDLNWPNFHIHMLDMRADSRTSGW